MPVTAILFDVGGVLLEWNPLALYRKHFPALSRSEIEAFLQEVDFAGWNLEQDRGRPFSEAVAKLSSRFPHRAALIRAYHEHWPDCIPGTIPGMLEIIHALKAGGLGIYGLSNFSTETFAIARRTFPVFAAFEDIVVSGQVGLVKPDPAIFKLALKRIGRAARECVFVDDAPVNVAAARELGLGAILFRDAGQLERELHEIGVLGPRGNNRSG